MIKNECVIDFSVQEVNQTTGCCYYSLAILHLENYTIYTHEDCTSYNYMINMFENISKTYDVIYVINADRLRQLKFIIPETTASVIYNCAAVPTVLFPEEVMTEIELNRFNYTTDNNLLQQPSYSLDRTYINIQCVKLYLQKKLL